MEVARCEAELRRRPFPSWSLGTSETRSVADDDGSMTKIPTARGASVSARASVRRIALPGHLAAAELPSADEWWEHQLRGLRPRDRDIVRLHCHGMRMKDIAARLGISTNRASMLHAEAIRSLRADAGIPASVSGNAMRVA